MKSNLSTFKTNEMSILQNSKFYKFYKLSKSVILSNQIIYYGMIFILISLVSSKKKILSFYFFLIFFL